MSLRKPANSASRGRWDTRLAAGCRFPGLAALSAGQRRQTGIIATDSADDTDSLHPCHLCHLWPKAGLGLPSALASLRGLTRRRTALFCRLFQHSRSVEPLRPVSGLRIHDLGGAGDVEDLRQRSPVLQIRRGLHVVARPKFSIENEIERAVCRAVGPADVWCGPWGRD